jgi:hypothetical protein
MRLPLTTKPWCCPNCRAYFIGSRSNANRLTDRKLIAHDVRMRFLSVLASLVAFPFLVLAEGGVKLDCTIQSWNEHSKKEKDHDYQHGYSTTKVAPTDIAWLRPGTSPVGPLGQARLTSGFVVLGGCKKTNITSSKELQSIMIKLSKLVSDHGGKPLAMTSPVRRYASGFSDLKIGFMLRAKVATEATLLLPALPLCCQYRARIANCDIADRTNVPRIIRPGALAPVRSN